MKKESLSRYYDLFEWPLEILRLKKLRSSIITLAKGKVLEIGAGTGRNLPYYHKNPNLTLTDISKEMLDIAKGRACKLNIRADFKVMIAEKLKFKDNTFDYVVATLVLCSVDDPVKALKEMKRICKNNGQIILLEHVRSSNPIIAKWQTRIKPIFNKYFGCNPDRDTLAYIKKAGLKPGSVKNVWMNDVFKEKRIKNKKS